MPKFSTAGPKSLWSSFCDKHRSHNIIQESFQNAEEIWQIKEALKQINARTDKGKNGQIVSRFRNKMRQKEKKELGNCLEEHINFNVNTKLYHLKPWQTLHQFKGDSPEGLYYFTTTEYFHSISCDHKFTCMSENLIL